MLKFVNFKKADTCVHRRILDIMLRVLSNLFDVLLDLPVCLCGDVNRTVRLFLVLKKVDKSGRLELLASMYCSNI